MDREGEKYKEEIPGSGRSMRRYILTYFRLYRENVKFCQLWDLYRSDPNFYIGCTPLRVPARHPDKDDDDDNDNKNKNGDVYISALLINNILTAQCVHKSKNSDNMAACNNIFTG